MWQPLEILNVFITLFLKLIFWKTKIFSKKLEHRFLLQSTKIESAIFPRKTTLPEKANRMGSTKCTYHIGWSSASNYLFENFVSEYEPLLKRWLDVPTTQISKFILFVSTGVLFEGAFSLWVSLILYYFVTPNFDSLSTKVCLRFHCWCFFHYKISFLVEHIYWKRHYEGQKYEYFQCEAHFLSSYKQN